MEQIGRMRALLLYPTLYFWLFFISTMILSDSLVKASTAEGFIDSMKHDIFLVTPKSFDSLINKQRNSDGVSILLHFKSTETKHKKFINHTYNEAAKEAKGMARFGAIDCSKWARFCQDNLNPETEAPFLVIYPPNPLPPLVLKEHDKSNIMKSVFRYVPDVNVKSVNTDNADVFLSSNMAIPKILLFSEKKKSPVLFKALSNAFKDRLSFGFVNAADLTLVNRHNIKSFPTIVLLKAAQSGSGLAKPLVYSGKMNFDNLHEWLNVHAETFVKGGGFSEHSAVEGDATPKPWLIQKIPEVTGPSHQDVCFKGSSLCVMFLSRGKITEQQQTMLEELSSQYSDGMLDRGARFKFMWMDIEAETAFQQMFGISLKSTIFPSLAVVNPHKRLRFLMLPQDKEATSPEVKALLERILSGDSRFTTVKGGKIPSFVARDADGQVVHSRDEL